MASDHDLLKVVKDALGSKIRMPGFRRRSFIKWKGERVLPDDVTVVVDLSFQGMSPAFGMGDSTETAVEDALARKGEVYAYVLKLSNQGTVAKIKDALYNYNDVVMDLPEAGSVAVSTRVNNMDMESVLKRFSKSIKGVTVA